jgi:hypothetical protein
MPRRNVIASKKLQVSVDATTDRVLEDMVPLGIHGKNKSEVASWIIREWIWHAQERLERNGIALRAADPQTPILDKAKVTSGKT